MGYVYSWNGSTSSFWTTLANWNTTATFTPQSGTLSDTQDNTATVIFGGGGPVVNAFGGGYANFFYVYGDQTFAGDFYADGQPAIGVQPYFTGFQVTAGTATFSGAGTALHTKADVLVGYGDPNGGSAANLVFSDGATATLKTTSVLDSQSQRISEDSLYIGYDHTGSVDIEGATTSVTTDSGVTLGVGTGVTGTLHVGAGALLHIGSYNLGFGFAVGDGGEGTLLIDGGASVVADGGVDIGLQAGSRGFATVDGKASDFHALNSIFVGTPSPVDPNLALGVGTLNVINQATVESDSSIKVFAGSVLNISGGAVSTTGLSGVGARILVSYGGEILLSGATLNATSTNAPAGLTGVQVQGGGLIIGSGTINGAASNDGTIEAKSLGSAQTLLVNATFGPLSDPATPGVLAISGDATLELMGGVANSETVIFNNTAEAGFHETLKIDGSPSAFQAPISGLQGGDVIDLAGVTGATNWSLNTATDVLSVENASGATLAALQLIGNFAGVGFATGSDGAGGFTLTQTAIATAPMFTSGGGKTANYVINKGFTSISQVQASGADVQYFLKDPRTGKLVASTSQFAIDSQTGALSFNKALGYGDYHVTVVAKNAAGQSSQDVDVDVSGALLGGRRGEADTYVFHAGFNTDALFGFQAQSAGGCRSSPHDVLQFDHSLFAGATPGESGSALIALLQANTQQAFGGALINTATNDHLYLVGVSKQSLLANAAADVHIV